VIPDLGVPIIGSALFVLARSIRRLRGVNYRVSKLVGGASRHPDRAELLLTADSLRFPLITRYRVSPNVGVRSVRMARPPVLSPGD